MKKAAWLPLFLSLLFIGCGSRCSGQTTFFSGQKKSGAVHASGTLELSFVYDRKSGFSTNQFAIWIEDDTGKHVQTVFVTRFAAMGGWEKQPDSVPLWVSRSGIAAMTPSELDAISGATPRSGELTFIWDCTDRQGNSVPAGTYTVYLEGTLRSENRVLFQAPVEIGGEGRSIPLYPVFSGDRQAERDMITSAILRYIPE